MKRLQDEEAAEAEEEKQKLEEEERKIEEQKQKEEAKARFRKASEEEMERMITKHNEIREMLNKEFEEENALD